VHPLWGLIASAVIGNLDAVRRLVALLALGRRAAPAAAPEPADAEPQAGR
jgi:hypothetical protein